VACFLSFCFCFSLYFFSSQAGKLKSRCPAWNVVAIHVFQRRLWPFLQLFFFDFSVPDLLNPIAFLKTRALQLHSSTSSAPFTESTGHAGRQSSTRGLYAPESSLLFGACDGHALLFSSQARWGWGIRWLICSWFAPVTTRILHAPPSPAVSALASTAGSLIFAVSICLCCVFSCFLLYSACVLLIFYWNFSWLDVRSVLFYLRVSVNIREAQM
jgi:hypothetical protein